VSIRKLSGDERAHFDESVRRVERQLTYALTKPRNIEGYVTLTQLAAEKGMQAQLARIYLQRAGIRRPNEGWRWRRTSMMLPKVRNALGLQP
jgi:hypothetical protein